jgi:hypothetical protein
MMVDRGRRPLSSEVKNIHKMNAATGIELSPIIYRNLANRPFRQTTKSATFGNMFAFEVYSLWVHFIALFCAALYYYTILS